jgi:hypothetical protein
VENCIVACYKERKREELKQRVQTMLRLTTIFIVSTMVSASCPNMCSGHGDCTSPDNRCACWVADRHTDTHWIGGDCSLRECPKGKAWGDHPVADNTAHQPVECSAQGYCDYETGNCKCRKGFMGLACNRLACPNDCNGHGVCRSMDYNARAQGKIANVASYANSNYAYTAPWDHDMIYGCACDTGYGGFDCSQRLCPTGDDPLTLGQVNDIQTVDCTCATNLCDGTFTIGFRGKTTTRISESANLATVKTAIEAISTISAIELTFSGGQACAAQNVGSPYKMTLEFIKDFGALPSISVASTSGAIVTTTKTQVGTKEEILCANRGICDYSSGLCKCNTGYGSSDGSNKIGDRGDCGHLVTTIGTCPTSATGAVCSGHGACSNNPEYVCTCDQGWDGSDCSLRRCPKGRAWFDTPRAANTAHADHVECSSAGLCDTSTGECKCYEKFHGSACQYMACPGVVTTSTTTPHADACSGHGKCLDMSHMGEFNKVNGDLTPFLYGEDPNDNLHWDGKAMHACMCDAGFTGYDCAQRSCPKGDDPMTGTNRLYKQRNEERNHKCIFTSTGGSFKVTFRSETSKAILHTATAAEVEAAILALPSINKVTVTFSNGVSACTTLGNNIITIKYITELGGSIFPDAYSRTIAPALPRMTFAPTGFLTLTDGWSSGFVMDSNNVRYDDVPGTKEFNLCSDRGLCNFQTGVCQCFLGYGSSDGLGGEGRVGDCGYVEPIIYKDGNSFRGSKSNTNI